MSRHGWKGAERKAAALFGLERWPANMGYRFDFGGGSEADGTPHKYCGQVKNTKSLSQGDLVALVSEMEEAGCEKGMIGVVVSKMSARKPTPYVVSMSGEMWSRIRFYYELGLAEYKKKWKSVRPATEPNASSSSLESASPSSGPSLPSMPPGTGLTGTHVKRRRASKRSPTISERRQAASAARSPSTTPSGTTG